MNAPLNLERASLAEAITRAGGKTQLLRLLNERGHSINAASTLSHWEITRVPANYCPDIEFITGVMCEALRPDVAWGVVRNSRKLKSVTSRTSPATETAATTPAGLV